MLMFGDRKPRRANRSTGLSFHGARDRARTGDLHVGNLVWLDSVEVRLGPKSFYGEGLRTIPYSRVVQQRPGWTAALAALWLQQNDLAALVQVGSLELL